MKIIDIRYAMVFGRGDSTDWIYDEFELTDEEAEFYDHAIANEIPPDEVPELRNAGLRAYKEVEKAEIEKGLFNDVDYVKKTQGENAMDPHDINAMVANRNPRALAFFGLEDASDEELAAWNAYDLDEEELPLVIDLDDSFEPYSPFDAGWSLTVELVNPNDEDEEYEDEDEDEDW